MEQTKKGIALILFGILLSMGGNLGILLAYGWLIGLPLGTVGLIMVLMDKGGKNL